MYKNCASNNFFLNFCVFHNRLAFQKKIDALINTLTHIRSFIFIKQNFSCELLLYSCTNRKIVCKLKSLQPANALFNPQKRPPRAKNPKRPTSSRTAIRCWPGCCAKTSAATPRRRWSPRYRRPTSTTTKRWARWGELDILRIKKGFFIYQIFWHDNFFRTSNTKTCRWLFKWRTIVDVELFILSKVSKTQESRSSSKFDHSIFFSTASKFCDFR